MSDLSYITEGLRSLAVPIDQLHEDPANARVGHDVDRIAASLRQYGQRKPIVVNRLQHGKIEAGNGTYRAARMLGWAYVAVVFVDDDPATAAGYGIADNRVGEFSRWDTDVLEELSSVVGESYTGFQPAELEELIGATVSTATKPQKSDPGAEPERADELLAKWQVKFGQVWVCGDHRLICGDATRRADLVQLLSGHELAQICWTDPPWNINYGDAGAEQADGRTMNNDNLGEHFSKFVEMFIRHIWEFCEPGAMLYLVMGTQEWPLIDQALRRRGFHWSSTIAWVKDQHVLSRKDYHTQYEPIWYGWKGDAARVHPLADRTQSDVWMIDRPKKSAEHPTMKPLELVERSLNNSSQPGDLVLELFSGSGTTLMACERLGRKCRAMENDPRFVAVALERWSLATNQTPVLEDQ